MKKYILTLAAIFPLGVQAETKTDIEVFKQLSVDVYMCDRYGFISVEKSKPFLYAMMNVVADIYEIPLDAVIANSTDGIDDLISAANSMTFEEKMETCKELDGRIYSLEKALSEDES